MEKASKMLFGILTTGEILDGLEVTINPYEQYLFEIWKNEDGYKIIVDTLVGFNQSPEYSNYMASILKEVKSWMEKHNFDTQKELDIYQVFTLGINVNTPTKTIEECYALFKLLVRGFKGEGIL